MFIEEEKLENIFDAFASPKISKGGTGLCLFIAKKTIEEDHKGKIKVLSKKGEGTEFTIMMPVGYPLKKARAYQKNNFGFTLKFSCCTIY